MGLFSKKKNTYVTNDYGLDEQQFDALSTGQTGLATSVQANFDQMQANAAAAQAAFEQASIQRDNAMAAAASAATAANETAASNYNNLNTAVTDGFAAQTSLANDNTASINSNINNQTDTLTGSMNSGFARSIKNVDDQFSALNQDRALFGEQLVAQNAQDKLDQMEQVREYGDRSIEDRIGFYQETKADNLANLAILQDQASTNQAANLEQQTAILSALEAAGLQNTNYYNDLKADTGDTITRLGNIGADFTNYREQYDDNTTLANQQRSQIAQAQAMNTNDLMAGQAVTNQNNQAAFAQQNQNQQQTNTSLAAMAAGQDEFGNTVANQGQDFASVAQMITSGFQANSAEDQAMRNEFVDRLDTVRTTLADTSANIDDEFRQTYGTMVDSFDSTGALIRQSALSNGDYITRAIDDQGSLILSQFSANGSLNNQTALNINQLMARMDELGYIPGSNVAMAGPTGTAQTYSGGTSNPYSATVQ